MTITVKGQGGISATIIADSQSALNGQRITTFELVYPRFIHSEFMTHRVFSRNAASSRAIPVSKTIELIRQGPAMPIHWGANQSGMQAHNELIGDERFDVIQLWDKAALDVSVIAERMHERNAHKQIVNRILEPFQFMKTVMTSTEMENWFWLRDHEDAQPEIAELAHLMAEAREMSIPTPLQPNEWHLPYVDAVVGPDNEGLGMIKERLGVGAEAAKTDSGQDLMLEAQGLAIEDALKISSSCCAQVSFRKSDESLDKAIRIYDRLVESEPVHASPFEHQATPMATPNVDFAYGFDLDAYDIHQGVTHVDMKGNFWSGNFKGWIQHRQLIPNHVREG